MRKFQYLFVLKRSYICYYIICMTVPLKNSLVNVTKSAGKCGFGHSYWRKILNGKLQFFCAVLLQWRIQTALNFVVRCRNVRVRCWKCGRRVLLFVTGVPIIWKPVHWFILPIDGLVSIDRNLLHERVNKLITNPYSDHEEPSQLICAALSYIS